MLYQAKVVKQLGNMFFLNIPVRGGTYGPFPALVPSIWLSVGDTVFATEINKEGSEDFIIVGKINPSPDLFVAVMVDGDQEIDDKWTVDGGWSMTDYIRHIISQ